MQDKSAEIAFFDAHARAGSAYDVFSRAAKEKLIGSLLRMSDVPTGAAVLDMGCGSGAFTAILKDKGYDVAGLDLSSKLIEIARLTRPDIDFHVGDAEATGFPDASFDCIMLAGVIHHFSQPSRLATEVRRLLRRGGSFIAFDPNRMNPFFYLYRDPSSPLYSDKGVTENERPILQWKVKEEFEAHGFAIQSSYLGGVAYEYVASRSARVILPVYNLIDRLISAPRILAPFRPFVLTVGTAV